jgi:hypothetical protein
MSAPVLNFVWLGPPKYAAGGQDVVGPETIARNFKTFPSTETPANPMFFWCQDEYVHEYRAHFFKKNIPVEVRPIKAYLHSFETDMVEQAKEIIIHYETLLNPDRNQPLDRVYMKDMFFNFLLATQGGYVLDTNIQAHMTSPVHFPKYSKFMFPTVPVEYEDEGESFTEAQTEVWMQYAPPENLTRARECLNYYLMHFRKHVPSDPKEFYSTLNHRKIGNIAGAAVLNSPRLELFESPLPPRRACNALCDIWETEHLNGLDASIPSMGIFKEYNNSHRHNHAHMYTGAHFYIYMGYIERLQFALEHGLPVDSEANPQSKDTHLPYNSNNETLLHLAMRYLDDEKSIACAKLLLEHGANPNKVHTFTELDGPDPITIEESPLTYAIKSQSLEMLRMLFMASTHRINTSQVLNNESPLLLAIKENCGVAFLLALGADPNQQWEGQTETPLELALRNHDEDTVTLLLKYGANPSVIDCSTEFKMYAA